MERSLCASLFASLFVGILLIGGCDQKSGNSPKEKSKPVTKAMPQKQSDLADSTVTKNTSQQIKENFMKDLKQQLTDLDTELRKLRVKGESLASDAKAKWGLKLSQLEVKRMALNIKLEEVGKATTEAWGDTEKGARSAWNELKTAVQGASKEF